MANLEKLLQARAIWATIPDDNFNLDLVTSKGGNTTTVETVACPVGWAIRHPDLQFEPYILGDNGDLDRSDEFQADPYLYIAKLFDMQYLDAMVLCRPRTPEDVWDSTGVPQRADWTDKQTFMRRLDVFLAAPAAGRRNLNENAPRYPTPAALNQTPGRYDYDETSKTFSFTPDVTPVNH